MATFFNTIAGKIAILISSFALLLSGGLAHKTEQPTTQAASAIVATAQENTVVQNTVGTSTPVATTAVVNQYITQPVIERTIQSSAPTGYVSEGEFTTKLNELSDRFGRVISGSTYPAPATTLGSGGVWNAIAATNKIDHLSGTSLSNITVSGVSGLTASDIPALNYLSSTGGTVTGLSNFANASTSLFSVFNNAYFGATATSSFASNGALTLATPLLVSSGGTGATTATDATNNLQFLQNWTGAVARSLNSKLGDTVSVKDFGAKGDGVTDDTAAIQAAVNFAALNHRTVLVPNTGSNYEISSAVTISGNINSGFGIVGDGTIEQITDNVPILHFSGGGQSRMLISGLTLTYHNAQPASNTSAVCMLFSGTGVSNYYNSTFSYLSFQKCNTGIAQTTDSSFFWGNRAENLYFYGNISGPAISLTSVAGGQPNNYFGNIYVLAYVNQSTLFQFSGQRNLTLENFEINALNNVPIVLIQTSSNVVATNIRVEGLTFDQDYQGLFTIAGVTGFKMVGYEIQSMTFNPTHTNYGFRDSTPYQAGIFDISGIFIHNVTGNNKFAFVDTTVNIGRIEQATVASNTGYLGDVSPNTGNSSRVIVGYSTISPWAQNTGNIYSNLNVGIGTSSPSSPLSVWGANTTSGVRAFDVTNSASTTGFAIDNAGNGYLAGNLSIGTTTPTSKLLVFDNLSLGDVGLKIQNYGGFGGNIAATASLTFGFGASTNASQASAAKLTAIKEGDFGSVGARNAALAFSTGQSAVLNERMRITSSGNVGIGTTTPWAKLSIAALPGNTAPLFTISTSTASATSTAFLIDQNGLVGIATSTPWRTLSVTGTVGLDGLGAITGTNSSLCLSANKEVVYNSNSDSCASSLRSTKHDIQNLNLDALTIVKSLQPASFVYNNDASSTVRYGFIAEDAAAVDAHFGTHDTNGNLSGIDDRSFIAVIVEALQSLIDKVGGFAERLVTQEIVAKNIDTDSINANTGNIKQVNTDKLCVGSTCLTESQVQALLNQAGQQAVPPMSAPQQNTETPSPDESSTTPETTTPTSEAGTDTTQSTDSSTTPDQTQEPAPAQ